MRILVSPAKSTTVPGMESESNLFQECSDWMDITHTQGSEVICPDVKQVGQGTKNMNSCSGALLVRAVSKL